MWIESSTGAFLGINYYNTNNASVSSHSTTLHPSGLQVDASAYNSIYTDSGKVYPLSLALNFIIKT